MCPGIYASKRERCSVHASPLFGGVMTCHRSRLERKQILHAWHTRRSTRVASANKQTTAEARAKNKHAQPSEVLQKHLRFDGEALINTRLATWLFHQKCNAHGQREPRRHRALGPAYTGVSRLLRYQKIFACGLLGGTEHRCHLRKKAELQRRALRLM